MIAPAVLAALVFVSPAAEKPAGREAAAAFSKAFVNDRAVSSVRAEVSSLGAFVFSVNARPVGDDAYLKPGFTHCRKRRHSFAYDVTDVWATAAGATNRVSAFVAPSWWNDFIGARREAPVAFAAEFTVVYADGTAAKFATDATWNASYETPFKSASIYGGEWYDARVTRCPAACAGDGGSVVCSNFTGVVTPMEGPAIELRRDLALKADRADFTVKPGEKVVVDFGQNSAAIPEFVATAGSGVKLTIRPAEMLNDAAGEGKHGNDGPPGSVYRTNLRGLKDNGAWVNYVFKGEDEETYHPTFTFFGYRYAELSADGEVAVKSIVSIPVTSVRAGTELGTIRTGVAELNRLIDNVRWGHYSNYLSIPTDCPQRNERHGWTADTQVFAAAALYDADCYDFLSKWMTDMRDSQHEQTGAYPSVAPLGCYGDCGWNRLGWGDAGVIVPWTCWRMTGNDAIVRANWESMKRFMASRAARDGLASDSYEYADWLSYEKWESWSGKAWKDGVLVPEAKKYWDYLSVCYWCLDSMLMQEMANRIGEKDDALGFSMSAVKAQTYLKTNFFAADGGLLEEFRDMQTPVLFALKLDLYGQEEARTAAVAGLRKNIADHGGCLQTGFLGTSIIMDTLSKVGATDVAYTLLLQHKNPSWLYSVDQGATTIWERWDSYTKDKGFGSANMNSFNHYAYGAVLSWMYGTMAGIRSGRDGGFDDEFHLAPEPDERVGFCEATYRTKKGVIRSAWRYAEGKCHWSFSVPQGSRAIVCTNGSCRVFEAGDYELEIEK